MARYIDADVLIEKMKLGEYIFAETPFQKGVNANTEFWISEIKYMPTADVVPKSEVDRLTNILDSYALQYGTVMDKHIVIEKARQEVAREIFEEIDRIVSEYCDRFIPPTEMVAMLFDLKKKYAESGGNDTLNNTKN